MILFFQILSIGSLVAYIMLIIMAMVHLRRQLLSERELLFWDFIVVFVPIGAIIAFIYFPPNKHNKRG